MMLAENDDFSRKREVPWKILAFFSILHLLMLVYDVANPEVFLHADRATQRFSYIQGFIEALKNNSFIEFLSSNGLAGDYLIHALLFLSIGKIGLIIFQIAITLLSGYALYQIARIFGFTAPLSSVATGVYLALPHTLIFPHQLLSEAIASPLLVISLWLMASFWKQQNYLTLAGSAIITSLATFVRPITLLWAFIPAFVLFSRKKIGGSIIFTILSFFPILLWMIFMLVATNHFSLGQSNHDMGHNLYQRIWKMSGTMEAASANDVKDRFLVQGDKGSISLQQYLLFAANYPESFISHAAHDTLVFAFKSGVERITIDYLALGKTADESSSALQNKRIGWRHALQTQGMWKFVTLMIKSQGLILLISLIGAALMVILTILAWLGIWRLVIDWKKLSQIQSAIAVSLIALPFYIWLFSQVITAVQSRHRSPAEAAIVLLAIYGATWIINYRSKYIQTR